jgi:hypothetical protein
LLLGYLVSKEQAGRFAAETALGRVQGMDRAATALDVAKSGFATALRNAGATDPDRVVSRMIAADDIRASRDYLKQRVDDLDAKLTALNDLQMRLDKVAESVRPDLMVGQIESAVSLQAEVRRALELQYNAFAAPSEKSGSQRPDREPLSNRKKADSIPTTAKASIASPVADRLESSNESSSSDSGLILSVESRTREDIVHVKQDIVAAGEFRRQYESQLGLTLKPGHEVQAVRDVLSAARSFQSLAKSGAASEVMNNETANLRGQVAFLRNRLNARGGRDFPPCWVDESGKVEFLFSVEIRPDSFVVNAAWPPRRDADARSLPGISDALARPRSKDEATANFQGILNWSKKQDPECRHYVQLKSSIADAVASDRARLMVENYFYKVEARR